jgi:hypothetical protein
MHFIRATTPKRELRCRGVSDRVALRLGYQNLFLQDSEVGLTLGAGVMGDMQGAHYRLDYGWADQGRLNSTQRFSLGIMF